MIHKLGRLPRKFDPRVPHWSALRYKLPAIPQAPSSESYTSGIPAIGMMGNDDWGDCACAGAYHLRQLWQWNATGTMPPEGTAQALQLYAEVTGFNINAGPPGNNPTDQGTCLQDLLAYWLKTGIPLADGTRHKILAYFEVDPLNAADLSLGTAESAGLYMGWNVPAFVEQLESPGSILGAPPAGADTSIVGGHCTVSGGYAPSPAMAGARREFESWGSTNYQMEPVFWNANVDEVYVILANDFVRTSGTTPFGLPLSVWEEQMAAIKEAA
jgi:hypothetical protein